MILETQIVNSTLTDSELCNLKVPGSYDQFSAMMYPYQLSDYLQLGNTFEINKSILAFFNENKSMMWSTAKTEKAFILFVYRWMCRGLTLDQAMRKPVLQHIARTNHIVRNRKKVPKWK